MNTGTLHLFPAMRVEFTYTCTPTDWRMFYKKSDCYFERTSLHMQSERTIDLIETIKWFERINTPEEVLAFLKKTDCFWSIDGSSRNMCFRNFLRLKELYWEASASDVSTWEKFSRKYPEYWITQITQPPIIELHLEYGIPQLLCSMERYLFTDLAIIIGHHLQLERMREVKRKWCARKGCQHTFPASDRSDKQFCSRNCAVLHKRLLNKMQNQPTSRRAK